MIGFYAAGAMGESGGSSPGPTPVFVDVGAQRNTAGSTTSVPWPVGHSSGQLGLMVVMTPNLSQPTPSGWALIGRASSGPADTPLSVMISVYGKIAASGAEPNVTVENGGTSLLLVRMFTFAGADPAGYIDASNTGAGATSSTITLPGLTTTNANRLVAMFICDGTDSGSSARYSSWANADLTSVAERFDGGTTISSGGGIGVATGERLTAGSVGSGSVNFEIGASNFAAITVALKPPNV